MQRSFSNSCFFAIFFSFLLSSCGIVSDRSNEYIRAGAGEDLVVPEWLNKDKINPLYPIPQVASDRALPPEYQLPEPPDATAVLDAAPYLVETLEGRTWLKLYTSPGKVWPLLDFYWREHNLDLQKEDIPNGYLRTYAIDEDNNESLFAEVGSAEDSPLMIAGMFFEARVVQGVRRNTAELQISTFLPDGTEVQGSQLEQVLLDLIGQYITSDEVQNRHSLLATDIGSASRVRMLEGEGLKHYIELELAFDRAWNEIDQALKDSGVLVADLDRSAGVFYVSYLTEEEIDSWFSTEEADNAARKEQNFVVRLSEEKEGTIRVDVELLNEKFESSKRYELLSIIFEHIS